MALIDSKKIIKRKIRKIGKSESANGYMSLTDKDIDKMYSASAEGLSFEYNESYWDQFESQLSSAQETSLSDLEIDSIYATSAAGLSFDFKPEYWNEFNAANPVTSSIQTSLSDAEIDSLYAASAASLGFKYNPEYWTKFNASLPNIADKEGELSDEAIDSLYAASATGLAFNYNPNYWTDFNESFTGDAVLSDTGIDNLYQESAQDLSFNYQPSYWEEFKGRLRRRRRPDFLWFATAYSFVGVMGVMLFMNDTAIVEPGTLVAESSRSEKAIAPNGTANANKLEKSNNANNSGTNSVAIDNTNKEIWNDNVVRNDNVRSHIASDKLPEFEESSPVLSTSNGQVVRPLTPSDLADLIEPKILDVVLIDATDGNVSVDLVDATDGGTRVTENNGTDDLITGISVDELPESQLATAQEEQIALPSLPATPFVLTAPDRSLEVPSPELVAPNFNLPKRIFATGYVQAFGGLSQSLVTPSDKGSYSYGVGVGVELHKRSLIYTFGVNAILENHNDLVLNRTAKVYGFGSNVYKFNIDYQQLYKLEGYLGIGYNLGRHSFNVGVRPSFVLSNRVRIEEIGSSTTVFATGDDYDASRYVYGFMDGIHRFGLKPTFGYSFNLTSTIKFGGTVGVEVMPSINEDFVNGMTNRLPIDGQLYIRKTFSFKR